MIDLNTRRKHPSDVVEIRLHELANVDLQTIQIGDWMEGFGDMYDFAILGFLHHCGQQGIKLTKGQ